MVTAHIHPEEVVFNSILPNGEAIYCAPCSVYHSLQRVMFKALILKLSTRLVTVEYLGRIFRCKSLVSLIEKRTKLSLAYLLTHLLVMCCYLYLNSLQTNASIICVEQHYTSKWHRAVGRFTSGLNFVGQSYISCPRK